MQVQITPDQTFTARAGQHLVHGLRVTDEWEGMRKLVDGTGRHLIVDAEGAVIKATPALLHDLHLTVLAEGFITVPATTLPSGHLVPSFQVGQYHCGAHSDGPVVADPSAQPCVNVTYEQARKLCALAGFNLITELQCLAIAHDIAQQDINWSGGKVGQGAIYQGLHKGTVNKAQAGTYESSDPAERRWHQLSNGARIYDFAGNVWSWVFDDMQGDESGLVKGLIAADSPSISLAPAPSGEKGVGYVPKGPLKWSGNALVRGGCWCSGSSAGVFRLRDGSPDGAGGSVGFRCTK